MVFKLADLVAVADHNNPLRAATTLQAACRIIFRRRAAAAAVKATITPYRSLRSSGRYSPAAAAAAARAVRAIPFGTRPPCGPGRTGSRARRKAAAAAAAICASRGPATRCITNTMAGTCGIVTAVSTLTASHVDITGTTATITAAAAAASTQARSTCTTICAVT